MIYGTIEVRSVGSGLGVPVFKSYPLSWWAVWSRPLNYLSLSLFSHLHDHSLYLLTYVYCVPDAVLSILFTSLQPPNGEGTVEHYCQVKKWKQRSLRILHQVPRTWGNHNVTLCRLQRAPSWLLSWTAHPRLTGRIECDNPCEIPAMW